MRWITNVHSRSQSNSFYLCLFVTKRNQGSGDGNYKDHSAQVSSLFEVKNCNIKRGSHVSSRWFSCESCIQVELKLEMLVFHEGGNREKNPRSNDENQQQTQPTVKQHNSLVKLFYYLNLNVAIKTIICGFLR